MLFKFPQKKIVLDCFTTNEHILKTAPIVPAVKLMPDWWKNLPKSYQGEGEGSFFPKPTMKHCIGMVDYYTKSIVMPLWSDLAINIKSQTEYEWQFSDLFSTASPHNISQQASGFLSGYAHIKLNSPWIFNTKEHISWVWSHPVYSYPNSNSVVCFPAVLDYRMQHGTNINLLVNTDTPKTIIIPQGQPMVHMTPMSDRKVEIVRHLISKEELAQKTSDSTPITFLSKYRKIIDRTEQFSDCPYHNHSERK